MKLFVLVFSLIFFFTSCKSNNASIQEEPQAVNTYSKMDEQFSNLPIVIYQETTRGTYRKITVQDDKIYVVTAQGAKPVFWELKKEDSKALIELFKNIDLESLGTFKAPTQKRFYDGAPIANLTFKTEDKTYLSTDFDGGFPPKEIEDFVNEMIIIAEKLNN
jgi:hypothetical protein